MPGNRRTQPERTAEERRLDREERERRRAAAAGAPAAAPAGMPLQEPPAFEPQAAEPQAVEPEAVEPEAVEPHAVEPEPMEPQAVEPEAVEPEAVQPQATELEDVEPQAVESRSSGRAENAPRRRMRAAGGSRAAGERHTHARIGALLALGLAILAVLAVLDRTGTGGSTAHTAGKVVIPEGETRKQIAGIAHVDGLAGSYLAASERSSLLSPAHYGAPRDTRTLEGFLFPATYDMKVGTPARRLVDEQLLAFRQKFGAQEIRRAHELHLTAYQLLVVASMVEREAAVSHDRPLVAAVIYNRLRLGMPLGIDATIRYALNDFTHPLTVAQLRIDSPYNTRTRKGLPPTPISNPGVASIQAAAHPATVSYLYYVAGADGCGEQVFSTNYTQFLRDAAAYQRAIAGNGGRVPACSKK